MTKEKACRERSDFVFAIKFVLRSLLDLNIKNLQLKPFQDLLFGRNGTVSYLRSFVSPGLSQLIMEEIKCESSWLLLLARESLLLNEYNPSINKDNLPFEEVLNLLVRAIVIAGIPGGKILVMFVLSELPLVKIKCFKYGRSFPMYSKSSRKKYASCKYYPSSARLQVILTFTEQIFRLK